MEAPQTEEPKTNPQPEWKTISSHFEDGRLFLKREMEIPGDPKKFVIKQKGLAGAVIVEPGKQAKIIAEYVVDAPSEKDATSLILRQQELFCEGGVREDGALFVNSRTNITNLGGERDEYGNITRMVNYSSSGEVIPTAGFVRTTLVIGKSVKSGEVEADGGDVTIRDINADLDIRIGMGDLYCIGTTGNIRGSVVLSNVDLRYITGEVELDTGVGGEPIHVVNMNGDLSLRGGQDMFVDNHVGRVKLKSHTGAISYAGTVTEDSSIQVGFNNIYLRLPSDQPLAVDAHMSWLGQGIQENKNLPFRNVEKVDKDPSKIGQDISFRGVLGDDAKPPTLALESRGKIFIDTSNPQER